MIALKDITYFIRLRTEIFGYLAFQIDHLTIDMKLKIFISSLILFSTSLLLGGCSEIRQQPARNFVINNPADSGTQYPNLYKDASGAVYMSWILRIDENLAALRYSTYKNRRWSNVKTAGISGDFFVNWADIASVVGYNSNVLAAHWLREFDVEGFATHAIIGFPGEDNRWQEAKTLHEDESMTEHGFVSLLPFDENRLLAIWLDGRKTEGRAHDEYGDPGKGIALRSAEVYTDGRIENRQEVDGLVCDCCQTSLALIEGGAIAAYRNRTENEVRDIAISRYDLSSGNWSEPTVIAGDNWEINGCPVNGPRIASKGERVAVSWYTMAGNEPKVQLARSADGGRTFQEPILISKDNTIGRNDVIVRDDGSVYVSYMVSYENLGYVMLRKLNPDGTLDDPVTVGVTASGRKSGFPRIVELDDGILFAWTQTDPLLKVRTAVVPYDYVQEKN